MYAGKELLDNAKIYASKAIEYEQKKQYNEAIKYYRRAIDSLTRLIDLYPDSIMNKNYAYYIMLYRKKVNELENLIEENEENSYEGGYESQETSSDSEYILEEKPNVKWEDIILSLIHI